MLNVKFRAQKNNQLRKAYQRLPAFRVCPRCEASPVLVAYEPEFSHHETWCWTCGAKNLGSKVAGQRKGKGHYISIKNLPPEIRELLRQRLSEEGR
jgi:hypothetical protein